MSCKYNEEIICEQNITPCNGCPIELAIKEDRDMRECVITPTARIEKSVYDIDPNQIKEDLLKEMIHEIVETIYKMGYIEIEQTEEDEHIVLKAAVRVINPKTE